MSEYMISLSDFDIRSILQGKKNSFRKPMEIQPVRDGNFWKVYECLWSGDSPIVAPGHSLANNCPFGGIGDYIWVWQCRLPILATKMRLKIKRLRVQRLQDISEEEAKFEGVDPIECSQESLLFGSYKARFRYRDSFMQQWDSFYKKDGQSWNENPWVWVVEFERVKQ